MKLLIIRHGESEADILNVHEGRADFNLTDKGHTQAQAMADYVSKNYAIDKIYASPLKRAFQTATHLSEATGIPVITNENLMEFNNGFLAGLSREEAAEKYPRIPNLPVHEAVYGQESKLESATAPRLFFQKSFRKMKRRLPLPLCPTAASSISCIRHFCSFPLTPEFPLPPAIPVSTNGL